MGENVAEGGVAEMPTAAIAVKRTKLHGRAFYESIGSPKVILAPMVDQSEFVCLQPTPDLVRR